MQKINSGLRFGNEILGQLRDIQTSSTAGSKTSSSESKSGSSFYDHLKEAISEVNTSQIEADKKASALASGKDTNIHETMLSATQAELSFNLMVQVRNKALEAYQEIMRMPV